MSMLDEIVEEKVVEEGAMVKAVVGEAASTGQAEQIVADGVPVMADSAVPEDETLPAVRTGTYLRAALIALVVALMVSAIVGVALVVLRPSLFGLKAPEPDAPIEG
jgi:hypothetical protein